MNFNQPQQPHPCDVRGHVFADRTVQWNGGAIFERLEVPIRVCERCGVEEVPWPYLEAFGGTFP